MNAFRDSMERLSHSLTGNMFARNTNPSGITAGESTDSNALRAINGPDTSIENGSRLVLPVDALMVQHLQDPLFAAAIGQPSRLNVPEPQYVASHAHSQPISSSFSSRSPPEDPLTMGLLGEAEARRLFQMQVE